MSQTEIQSDLLTYVREQCDPDIEPDSDLLASGYVDSLLVMDLVVYIKRRFEVALAATDLAPRHFRSIGRLAELVLSKSVAT